MVGLWSFKSPKDLFSIEAERKTQEKERISARNRDKKKGRKIKI